MNLNLIRGDTNLITFKIKTADNAYYTLKNEDKLYFTVKRRFADKNVILQKTEKNGITYNSTTNKYQIKLTQDCTCNISCGNYVYDIKLVLNDGADKIVKTLTKGNICFDNNATHKENE